MGMQTSVFKCPYCEFGMTQLSGPNWSLIDGIALHGSLVMLVCPNVQCGKVIGSAHVASRQQRSP